MYFHSQAPKASNPYKGGGNAAFLWGKSLRGEGGRSATCGDLRMETLPLATTHHTKHREET